MKMRCCVIKKEKEEELRRRLLCPKAEVSRGYHGEEKQSRRRGDSGDCVNVRYDRVQDPSEKEYRCGTRHAGD